MICKICDIDINKLGRHISKYHNISTQEYYEKFISVGLCLECNQKTKFKNMIVGFKKFCSVKCLQVNNYKDWGVLHDWNNANNFLS